VFFFGTISCLGYLCWRWSNSPHRHGGALWHGHKRATTCLHPFLWQQPWDGWIPLLEPGMGLKLFFSFFAEYKNWVCWKFYEGKWSLQYRVGILIHLVALLISIAFEKWKMLERGCQLNFGMIYRVSGGTTCKESLTISGAYNIPKLWFFWFGWMSNLEKRTALSAISTVTASAPVMIMLDCQWMCAHKCFLLAYPFSGLLRTSWDCLWVTLKMEDSALYVVDLVKFRKSAAGDNLRVYYESLSKDPNSLSNLDQVSLTLNTLCLYYTNLKMY